MARRPSMPSMSAAISTAQAEPLAAPVPAAPPKPRSASREGKRGVTFWMLPEASRQLGILAAEKDTTIQALMEEATQDLFRKHGKHRIS